MTVPGFAELTKVQRELLLLAGGAPAGGAPAGGASVGGASTTVPAVDGLTKVQREKIALADVVLAADRVIRESFCSTDKEEQGGFRYVQPISDLAKGVVEKRLPPGCPEMARIAVIARNLDPVITQAMSIRFTSQYKLAAWGALSCSSGRVAHELRRGRQDPSDTTTTPVYQLLKTGELLPSLASLERFMNPKPKGIPQEAKKAPL